MHHTKADNPFVIKNLAIKDISTSTVEYNDFQLNLCISTQQNYLIDIIKSKPCIYTLERPRGLHATAELDNESVLVHDKITGIILLENAYNEKIAMANASVSIEDLGVNFNVHSRVLAISNRKKRREIEWQRRLDDQETKLMKTMEHCSMLTKALEEVQFALEERNNADLAREQKFLKAKMEREKNDEKKVATLEEGIWIPKEDTGRQCKLDENGFKKVKKVRKV